MVIATCMRVNLAIVIALSISCQARASVIALFHALDEDLAELKREGAAEVRSYTIGSVPVQQLSLVGHTIYAVKMGSGCVQTCLSAQALLAKQKCDLAISIGPVGDIKGILTPQTWYRVSEVVSWQCGTQGDTGFVVDRAARHLLDLPQNKANPDTYANLPVIAVASGEMFVASDSFRADLAAQTRCVAVDMNLFGLITVLSSHQLQGIHLRTPSDRADSKASEDFRLFAANYRGEGGRLAAQMIRTLPEDRTSPNAHAALRQFLNAPKPEQRHTITPQSGPAKDDSANPADAVSQPAR